MRVRGFTLVELLVSMFIAAVMFAMGYGALNQALADRGSLQAGQERLDEIQTAMRVMAQDFAQIAPRPVRSPLSADSEPALRGDPEDPAALVTLTRAGWANPAGVQRPALQRVRYGFENEVLYRDHWRVVDVLPGTTPERRELIDRVRNVRFRYLDGSRSWQEEWSGVVTSGSSALRQLRDRPLAIEITLELEDYGTLTRIIEATG